MPPHTTSTVASFARMYGYRPHRSQNHLSSSVAGRSMRGGAYTFRTGRSSGLRGRLDLGTVAEHEVFSDLVTRDHEDRGEVRPLEPVDAGLDRVQAGREIVEPEHTLHVGVPHRDERCDLAGRLGGGAGDRPQRDADARHTETVGASGDDAVQAALVHGRT